LFYDDFSADPRGSGTPWAAINSNAADTFVVDRGALLITPAQNTRVGAGALLTMDDSWNSGFRVRFRFMVSGVQPSGDGFGLTFFHDDVSDLETGCEKPFQAMDTPLNLTSSRRLQESLRPRMSAFREPLPEFLRLATHLEHRST
jgi:hypothetical protein